MREGLDLPEVSLVAVLDADKEGFLRSETTLIQVCGRAARNVNGRVILYADRRTGSMDRALGEMEPPAPKTAGVQFHSIISPPKRSKNRSRNSKNSERRLMERMCLGYSSTIRSRSCIRKKSPRIVADLEIQMREAADNLQFELAAVLRDKINEIRQMTLRKKS